MIASDTSTWIAYLQGEPGEDAELLDQALEDKQVLMSPVVLTELLSDPKLGSDVAKTLAEIPLIEISEGYWQRAGRLRAHVLAKRRKARLGDALIAQSCVDRGVALLTRTVTSARSRKLPAWILWSDRQRTELGCAQILN
jgi:predicted nucleic acid-binding protein